MNIVTFFVEGHFLLLLEYSMKRLTLTGSCVTEVLRCCCLLILLLIQLGEGQEPTNLPSNGKNMNINKITTDIIRCPTVSTNYGQRDS